MTPGSGFKQAVSDLVMTVPAGQVVSYGQIAAALGSPRAARQVGWVMHTLDGNVLVPWWRVVNNAGRLTIKGNLHATADLQKQLLEKEGVVIGDNYTFDISRYRFNLHSG